MGQYEVWQGALPRGTAQVSLPICRLAYNQPARIQLSLALPAGTGMLKDWRQLSTRHPVPLFNDDFMVAIYNNKQLIIVIIIYYYHHTVLTDLLCKFLGKLHYTVQQQQTYSSLCL